MQACGDKAAEARRSLGSCRLLLALWCGAAPGDQGPSVAQQAEVTHGTWNRHSVVPFLLCLLPVGGSRQPWEGRRASQLSEERRGCHKDRPEAQTQASSETQTAEAPPSTHALDTRSTASTGVVSGDSGGQQSPLLAQAWGTAEVEDGLGTAPRSSAPWDLEQLVTLGLGH